MKTEINEYLFLEFGGEGDISDVSETWPFVLTQVGVIGDDTVFSFSADGEEFYAISGQKLTFYQQDGFSVDDLHFQILGSRWIGERSPIDLNTSRGDHPVIPRAIERKAAIEALAQSLLRGGSLTILEGLFLEETKGYLALVHFSDESEFHVVGDGFTISGIPVTNASRWRILAREVGQSLAQMENG